MLLRRRDAVVEDEAVVASDPVLASELRFHDLRHTVGSLLGDAGLGLDDLRERPERDAVAVRTLITGSEPSLRAAIAAAVEGTNEKPVLGVFMRSEGGPAAQRTLTSDSAAAAHRTVLDRYCVTCHNARTKAGDLVLFESWLRHEVPPARFSGERISISFNYGWAAKAHH